MERTSWLAALESIRPSFIDEGLAACVRDPSVIDLHSPCSRLTLPALLPHFHARPALAMSDLLYASTRNDGPFLGAVAAFLAEYLRITEVQLLAGGDLGFYFDQITLSFCEPGELVLLPSDFPREFVPYFARAAVHFVDAASLPEAPPANARLLFLTNPTVPFPDRNAALVEWALKCPDLQVVVDESFGASGRSRTPFRSLVADPRIHGLFSLSKFFGLSGLHISVLYSRCADFIAIVRETFGAWRNDSYAQWICREILSDAPLVGAVVSSFRELMREAERFIVAECEKAGIGVTTYEAGVYVRLDFGALPEDELGVFQGILERDGVFACPASIAFGEDVPGRSYVNLAIPRDQLAQGIGRLFAGIRRVTAQNN
jgi:histidinol-phosphate/aromatic aminotransferase/cobyric acid decarboxylase-like protein